MNKKFERICVVILTIACLFTSDMWVYTGTGSGVRVSYGKIKSKKSLKKKPAIKNFKYYKSGKKFKVAFTVKDPDHALKGGTFRVFGNKNVKKSLKKIKVGKNVVTLKGLKKGKQCKVKISLKYDLDGKKRNKSGDGTVVLKNKKIVNKKFNAAIGDVTASVDRESKNTLLTFAAKTAPKGVVKWVVIDGKDYKAKHTGTNYTVKVPCELDKRQALRITHIVLNNSMQLKVSSNDVVIFKNRPSVSMGKTAYEKNNNAIVASWTLTDSDSSVSQVYASLKKNGTVIQTENVSGAAAGNISFQMPSGHNEGVYTIEIAADYDILDGLSHIKEPIGSCELSIAAEKDQPNIQAPNTEVPSTEAPSTEAPNTEAPSTAEPGTDITDYQFKFENAVLSAVDNEKKTVAISFESTNTSSYKVSQVVLNDGKSDKTYNVTEEENGRYSVRVTLSNKEKATLTIKEAILENGRHFTIKAEQTGFVIFKNAPQAEVFDMTCDVQNLQLNAAWALTDSDKTVSKMYAVLKKDGIELESSELSYTARTASFKLPGKDIAGTYVMELSADYDAADGLAHQKELLGSTELKIAEDIEISKSSISNEYPQKGEVIDIILGIESNAAYDISAVTINGTQCKAKKQEDGTYKVQYTAPDKAGKETILVESLKYGSSLAMAGYTVGTIDVLKTAPSVSDLSYSDMNGERIVTFKLNDEDHAFVSGTMAVTDEKGEVKETKELSKDTLDYSFDVLKDTDKNGRYYVSVSASYDLDSDADNQKHEETKEIGSGDFDIIVDYQFSFDNAVLLDVDYDGKEAKIGFRSRNASDHSISKVVVSGKEYTDIEKDPEDPEEHTLRMVLDSNKMIKLVVEEVELDNGKRFAIDPSKTGYVIFKSAPVADIKNILTKDGAITADYSISDPDSTITDYRITLRNNAGESVVQKSKAELNPMMEGTVRFDNLTAGIYKIEIAADYDVADGSEPKNDEVLKVSDDIVFYIDVEITGSTLSDKYTEKGGSIDICYEISSNTNEDITALVINEVDYIAHKQEDGTYKVVYHTGSVAGYEKITVSAVKYDTVSVPVEHIDKIEVLKSVPSAEIITDYTKDNMELLVNVTDTEDTFLSGKIDILQSNNLDMSLQDYVVKTQEVNVGGTTVDLSSLSDKFHVAVVTVEYALGQDKEDSTHISKLVANKSFEVINDYKFTLGEMKVDEIDNESGTATISFVSSNRSSGYYVSEVMINDKPYPVTKKDMVKAAQGEEGASWSYSVEVPYSEKTKQVLKLTGVTLDNGKKINNLTGNEAAIFKNKPEVQDSTLIINKDTNDCKLNFNLKDEDKTITSLKAVLENAVGDKVQEVSLSTGQTFYTVDFSSFENDIGQYTARVIADYELVDGSVYKDVELANASAEVTIDINNISATADKYIEKGGQVKITCTITDNVPYYVQSFEITSSADADQAAKEYNVTKESDTEDTTVYNVMVPAPDAAGDVTYTLSKIHYIDEKDGQSTAYTAEVKGCSAAVEVLKTVPVLDSYLLDEEDDEFTFKLTDADSAMTEMKVTAKEKGTGNKITLNAVKRDGIYAVDIKELSKDKVYEINILVSYDLDNERDNGTNTGTVSMDNEIDLFIRYAASLKSMKVDKINTVDTKAEITFSALVTADEEPADTVWVAQAVINGNTYDVTKAQDADTYTAAVPYTGDNKQIIKIEQLILSNGLKFECTANNTADIFKTTPKADDLTLSIAENKISAEFSLQDTDAVISSLKAVLLDETGAELKSQTIDTKESGKKKVTFEHDASKAGVYKVTINADYDRLDGITHMNEELANSTTEVGICAVIDKCTASPEYLQKGGDIKIAYTVTDNTDLEISGFVIDGTIYTVESDETDGKYTITMKAPDKAGKVTYETTAVVYGTDRKVEVAEHCTAHAEVLKDAPDVANYVVNAEEKKISFSITDNDSAFISGKVTVSNDGSEVEAYNIEKAGDHSFEIPEEVLNNDDETHTVHFKLTYDLDEDQTPGSKNYTADKDVRSQTLEFQTDADIYIDNVEVTKVNKEDKTVEIAFTAANDEKGLHDDNHIRSVYINGEEYTTEHNHETDVYTLKDRLKYEEDDGIKQTFTIEKALLGTGTELDMTEHNVTFDIFRELPAVENLQVSIDEKNVSVDFRLQDLNEDIDNAYVLLKRSVFNEVYGNTEIHEIDTEEIVDPRTGEHHAELQLQDIDDAYDFTVEVAADFDVADGEEHVEDVLLKQTGEVKIRSNILQDSLNTEEDLGGDIVEPIIEKNQKMRIAFEVTDNTELDATGMEINGETYTVNKDRPTDDGNIYLADVQAPDEAGEQGFHVTKIYYGNKESDVNYDTGKRKILKEKPTLENYTDGGFDESPYLDFTFEDVDNTLEGSAVLTITAENDSVKKTETLEKGKHYHIDLSDKDTYPDGMYKVSVKASYYDEEEKKVVRDADLLEDDILHLQKRLQIKRGLGFKGSLIAPTVFFEGMPFMFGVSVDSIGDALKEDNEKETLITGFKVAKVREGENGAYQKTEEYIYEPEKDTYDMNYFVGYSGGIYNGFIMKWTLDPGFTYIYYESVFLSDGTEVALDWYSNYSILKTFPEVKKTTLKEDVKANTVTAATEISDPDNTINRLRLRLKASNGRVLAEKYISKKELDEKLKASTTTTTTITEVFDSTKMPMTNRYNLEVMLEYDAMGRGEYMIQTLGNASVTSAERVVIRDHRVLNPYPKKGEKVTLEYNIADNLSSGIDIIGAVINGQQVEVSSSKDDIYQFEVEAPTDSGIHDYTATAIVLSNKNYNLEKKEGETEEDSYNFQPTDTVDVLKTTPYITDCRLTDDPDKDTAQFEFTLEDPDEALTEGNAGVAKVGESEKTLVSGKNTITFENLQEDIMLSMDVLANFDLDSDEFPDEEELDKNTHTKESILDKPVEFMILKDYQLTVSELHSLGADDTETTDFEKGVSVGLTFDSTNKANIPVKQVVVGDSTYDVERDEEGFYQTRVKGYTDAGKHNISIDKVILENGKTLSDIKNKETIEVEVLKDVVSVEKLKYKTNNVGNNTTMTLSINVNDADNSLVGKSLDVSVTDKATGAVVKKESIAPNTTTDVTFPTGEGQKFDISVMADYKRTVDDTDIMNDQQIYKKTVSKESRTIEMKAIQDVRLYKMENGIQTAVETVAKGEITDENMKNYTVRVDMKNMPAFYSVLEGVEERDGKIILKISYEGAVDYSSDEPNKENIEIEFVPVENDRFAYDGSFAMLLKRMRDNPTNTYKLTKDYDASTYTTEELSYFGKTEFSGTLDGNGFTISNMSKPLFEKINKATIKNLYIINAQITTRENERAVLAHTANNVTVTNVFMDTINISASMNGTPVGGMFLDVKGASTISESSITNLMISGCYLLQRSGAFASTLSSSKISNCYAQGVINSGYQGDGGIAGSTDQTSAIEYCISNQSLTPYFGPGSGYSHLNGGNIVGVANNVTLKNNIAIADRNNAYAYKVYNGTGKINEASENNYYLSDTAGIANEGKGVEAIESSSLNEEFYRNTLKLDDKIWNLAGASAEHIPTLINNRLTSPYIPSYERIKDNASYNASKEIAYNNLYKLMPFYDASYVIEDAEKINTGDTLNTKKIQGIIPYNGEDKVIYALDTRNFDQIKKIRLIFTDGTSETYDVTYDITLGDVACYDIPSLGLKYTYNHYIVNASSPFIDELVNELYSAGDYATALDPVTANKDPFTYKWFYDEQIRKKDVLKEFVIKVVANSGYSVTTGNSTINTAIREELTKDNRLLKMLYAYNYYMRWYNFDIGEFNIADMIMFKGDIFSDIMTFESLADTLLSNPGDTMRTGATDEYYNKYLSAYTGIAKLPDFLNRFIYMTGKYTDVNDWFTEHFKGELIEIKMDKIPDVDIEYDNLKYRAWEHLSARPNLMLPFIMIPEDGAYIISLPTIMAFGSQRTYVRDIVAQKEQFKKSMQSWANALKTYYNMYLGILSGGKEDVVELFNARDDYINDTVAIYENPTDNVRTTVNLQTTKDAYYKWFGEPTGKAYFHSANYAAANGRDIFYAQGQFFGNMILFAHECAHNHDGPLYFKGNGRRAGTGAETFTTGFFTQSFTEGSPQINGYYRWSDDTKVANNLTPERINSTAKIDDFYKKAFEASYFLDYLAGEAFLELNDEQRAAIASVAPDNQSASKSSVMQRVTKAEIEEMKLTSVDDLIEHRIDLTNSISGGQSMYAIRWYEPHSATSVVSDDVFHYMAYEMLGYAGYDNGFIQYCGKIHDNDITALTEISKLANNSDNYKTFNDFKKGEFKKVMDKKSQISYINPEEVKKEFKEAMEKDANGKDRGASNTKLVKQKYYQILKQNTDDFRGEIFQEKKDNEMHVSTAEDFIKTAVKDKYAQIVLDQNLDFSDYDSESAIVGATFLGTVKGNDKTISNLSVPLFKRLGSNAKVENLKLSNANLTVNYAGAGVLANYMDGAVLSSVSLDTATIDAGNKSMIGGLIGSASNTKLTNVTAKDVTINGYKELGGVAGSLKDSVVTGGSVENVAVTGTDDSIGGYAGYMCDTQMSDITAKAPKVQGRRNVGGVAGLLTSASESKQAAESTGDPAETQIKRSELKNSSSVKAEVSGTTKIGGLVGYAEKYSIIKTSSTAEATVKSAGNSTGGFVGELYDTEVTDCYVIDANVYGREYIGGFVGYVKNAEIKNCYSHGEVGGSLKNFGGFIGTVNTAAKLENNLSLANVEGNSNAYKFDACTGANVINAGYNNNYEVKEYKGIKFRNNTKTEAIKEIEQEKLKQTDFYSSCLKWNTGTESSVWDFSGVTTGGFPKLTANTGDAQTLRGKDSKR